MIRLARESEPALIAYNLVLVESSFDAMAVSATQLYDFFYEPSECENCGMVVGPIEDEFFPCVVVCDEDDIAWTICVECAFPVVNPNPA